MVKVEREIMAETPSVLKPEFIYSEPQVKAAFDRSFNAWGSRIFSMTARINPLGENLEILAREGKLDQLGQTPDESREIKEEIADYIRLVHGVKSMGERNKVRMTFAVHRPGEEADLSVPPYEREEGIALEGVIKNLRIEIASRRYSEPELAQKRSDLTTLLSFAQSYQKAHAEASLDEQHAREEHEAFERYKSPFASQNPDDIA